MKEHSFSSCFFSLSLQFGIEFLLQKEFFYFKSVAIRLWISIEHSTQHTEAQCVYFNWHAVWFFQMKLKRSTVVVFFFLFMRQRPIHLKISFVHKCKHQTHVLCVVDPFLWCSYHRNEIPCTKHSSGIVCNTLVISSSVYSIEEKQKREQTEPVRWKMRLKFQSQ